MIKTVLVHLRGTKSDAPTLSAALQIARPFAAHLECLHIRPNLADLISRAAPATMDDDTDALTKIVEQLQKASAESGQRAWDAFTEFCIHERIPRGELATGSANQISASFREDIGNELERLTAQTRRHDLIVVKGGSTRDGGLG